MRCIVGDLIVLGLVSTGGGKADYRAMGTLNAGLRTTGG